MREGRAIMGMPVWVEIVDRQAAPADLEAVFAYFHQVDADFSTYKESSEISRINAGLLRPEQYSEQMRYVLGECKRTKRETRGYFDICRDGRLDPSGYVKGWAIQNAAEQLAARGFANYYVEIGGDLQVAGTNASGGHWTIGIRNPFNEKEIVKRVALPEGGGMATSGTYLRGQHIYDPFRPGQPLDHDLVSLTVIGPAIVDADRYATAAFAMGREGIGFIEGLEGFEGYAIDRAGIATFTRGFSHYVAP